MKSIVCTIALVLSTLWATAQVAKPVSWKFEVSQNEDDSYTLRATATMDAGWAIYSQHTGEGGPIPLSFTYDDTVNLIGKTEEKSDAIKEMSELFEVEVIKFKKEAIFEQKFTPKKGQNAISGYLTFMCCDSNRCLPPNDVDFEVAL